jgi:hypothetical protein
MASKNVTVLASAAFASIALFIGFYYFYNKSKKTSKKTSKSNILKLPVIELQKYFNKYSDPETYKLECTEVANALHKYGVAIVRDPRVVESHNNKFLDMLEHYFEESDGVRDARPQYHYQVGVTPSYIGRTRSR